MPAAMSMGAITLLPVAVSGERQERLALRGRLALVEVGRVGHAVDDVDHTVQPDGVAEPDEPAVARGPGVLAVQRADLAGLVD